MGPESLRPVLDLLLDNFRTVLIGGIVGVIVVSRFHRLAGAWFGLFFAAGTAVLGSQVYARGEAVGIGPYPLPPVGFYIVCAFLAILQLFSLKVGLSQRARSRREELS